MQYLWISKIHQLIKQFIDDDEVIPDAFFFQLLEIFRKHLKQHEKLIEGTH